MIFQLPSGYNPVPRFCTECGRPLEQRTFTGGFDAFTGQPRCQSFLMCPLYPKELDNPRFGMTYEWYQRAKLQGAYDMLYSSHDAYLP